MAKTVLEEFGVFQELGEVGIEIEMEGRGLEVGNNIIPIWKQKFDGSLRGESVEYVLRHPIGRKTVDGELIDLQTALLNSGALFKPSDRCGVHIHLNVQDWTTKKVFNLITLYLMLENVLVNYCGPTREGNLFCLRGQDADYLIQIIMQAKRKNTLHPLLNNALRYASLNIGSIGRFGSLEFRALQTPKKLHTIGTWVKLLLAVKDSSLNFKDGPSMIESFSMDGPQDFLFRVFGEKLSQKLMVDGWERRLEMAVRMVQDVAYTSLGRAKTVPKKLKLRHTRQPGELFEVDGEIEENNGFLNEPIIYDDPPTINHFYPNPPGRLGRHDPTITLTALTQRYENAGIDRTNAERLARDAYPNLNEEGDEEDRTE